MIMNVARKMLLPQRLSQEDYAMNMKQLIAKLEAFFSAMTLVDDCKFKRGLRIRPKPANSTARGKSWI